MADAARRSIRSGRKNRASEQREDFSGHRKAARPPIGRVMVAQKVTLPSLWGEQAAIWIDGSSPATGEGNGEGADTPWLPWERICAQYGRCFASFVSSTASDRKGFVKGDSVPLDRVLPTFARTKVGPRRGGVQTRPLQKAPRRRRRDETLYWQPLSQPYG